MQLPLGTYQSQTKPMQSHINVGSGSNFTFAEVAHAMAEAVGYQSAITFDTSKPDGPPRKWMDSSTLKALGWSASTTLAQELGVAYQEFLEHHA
jgi:GDP-L-fucose synthase